jgi:hypothetical protein
VLERKHEPRSTEPPFPGAFDGPRAPREQPAERAAPYHKPLAP